MEDKKVFKVFYKKKIRDWANNKERLKNIQIGRAEVKDDRINILINAMPVGEWDGHLFGFLQTELEEKTD